MDTAYLREATRAEHASTEDAVPLMQATLTRAGYAEILRGFYRIVRAWDVWAAANVPDDLCGVLAERRHASLLAEDLGSLGEAVPADDTALLQRMAETAVAGDPRSVFLGRMYVMEGSTLGGQMLARHVEETLGLVLGKGNSYFRGYGQHTGERWRDFKSLLAALPERETETVVATAKGMFALFAVAMVSVP